MLSSRPATISDGDGQLARCPWWPGCYLDVALQVLTAAADTAAPEQAVSVAISDGREVVVTGLTRAELVAGLRRVADRSRRTAAAVEEQLTATVSYPAEDPAWGQQLMAWSAAVLRAEHAEHIVAGLGGAGSCPGAALDLGWS